MVRYWQISLSAIALARKALVRSGSGGHVFKPMHNLHPHNYGHFVHKSIAVLSQLIQGWFVKQQELTDTCWRGHVMECLLNWDENSGLK